MPKDRSHAESTASSSNTELANWLHAASGGRTFLPVGPMISYGADGKERSLGPIPPNAAGEEVGEAQLLSALLDSSCSSWCEHTRWSSTRPGAVGPSSTGTKKDKGGGPDHRPGRRGLLLQERLLSDKGAQVLPPSAVDEAPRPRQTEGEVDVAEDTRSTRTPNPGSQHQHHRGTSHKNPRGTSPPKPKGPGARRYYPARVSTYPVYPGYSPATSSTWHAGFPPTAMRQSDSPKRVSSAYRGYYPATTTSR